MVDKNLSRWYLTSIALSVFLVLVVLYDFAPWLYFRIMSTYAFGVWKYPFLDLEAVPAALACWHRGINVYVVNPCDSLGRSGVYSPIWLWLPAIPTGSSWTNLYGVSVSLLFFFSLTVLPSSQNLKSLLFVVEALISPFTVFAVERGNIDLIIFIGCALFIVLIGRSTKIRQIGYAVGLLVGLLKWYPLPILCLAMRERFRIALGVWLLAGGILVAFILAYRTQVISVINYVPTPTVYAGHGNFGSLFLAEILKDIMKQKLHVSLQMPVFLFVLDFISVVIAAWLAARSPVLSDLGQLNQRQRDCLLVGAVLICGCFLTGVSIGYRGIFLLFILPGVLALSDKATGPRSRLVWLLLGIVILGEMWTLPLEFLVVIHSGWISPVVGVLASSYTTIVFLFLREGGWWLTVTLLLAIILREILLSRSLSESCAFLSGNGMFKVSK